MRIEATRRDVRRELRREIEACGYFPDVVEDGIVLALAGEDLVDFVVHHEPTFDHDEIHRHVTVLALTATRLLVGHTDDQPADHGADHPVDRPVPAAAPGSYAASSTESVPLRQLGAVVLTRVVDEPQNFRPDRPRVGETWLSITWGSMRRLDLEPASCGDPQCEADHGYTGTLAGDDLTVRMSEAADGADRVGRLVRFATTLQRVTAQ